jgi:chemotaxis protein CheC
MTALNAVQADALREIANIGAGHAATVLSQMTETPVMIDVPQVRLSALADVIPGLAGPDGSLVAISMRMMGDLTGDAVFVLHTESARRLAGVLLHRAPGTLDLTAPMVRSGLQEVGNIMVSAFLNALATCLGMLLMPSVPNYLTGDPAALRGQRAFEATDEPVLVIETAFIPKDEGAKREGLGGVLLFLPDPPSLIAILQGLPRAFGR